MNNSKGQSMVRPSQSKNILMKIWHLVISSEICTFLLKLVLVRNSRHSMSRESGVSIA